MTTATLRDGVDARTTSVKPDKVFESFSQLPVQSASANSYLRLPLGSAIPTGAVISAARLKLYQVGAFTGSNTISVQRVASWKTSTLTWNNAPATSGSAVSVTQSGTADGALWQFDVTADVQAFYAGSVSNHGWVIKTTSGTRLWLRGLSYSSLVPVLEIDYTLAPAGPTDLNPSGVTVSATQPMLKWTSPGDITAVHVQIDPTGVFTSPTFDSGWVAATSPRFDLSTSAYGGISSGSTYWRVQVRNSQGDSAWSSAVQFTRVALPTVTITNPPATTNDPTPPVTWTSTGQTSRRVVYKDASGNTLDDSGWAATTSTVYTPLAGPTAPVTGLTIQVLTKDDTARVDNENGHDYASATLTTAYARGAVTAVTSLAAAQQGVTPWVTLTWQRSSVPDGYTIVRDGVELSPTILGTDAFVSGTSYSWTDYTCPPNGAHTYQVLPIVSSVVGSSSPAVSVTPVAQGIWLIDTTTLNTAVLWGQDAITWDSPEVATVYTPPTRSTVIRRVIGRRPAEGSLSGTLTDVPHYPTGSSCETVLKAWALLANPQVRLVIDRENRQVILGDINLQPSPNDLASQMLVPVTMSFWAA